MIGITEVAVFTITDSLITAGIFPAGHLFARRFTPTEIPRIAFKAFIANANARLAMRIGDALHIVTRVIRLTCLIGVSAIAFLTAAKSVLCAIGILSACDLKASLRRLGIGFDFKVVRILIAVFFAYRRATLLRIAFIPFLADALPIKAIGIFAAAYILANIDDGAAFIRVACIAFFTNTFALEAIGMIAAIAFEAVFHLIAVFQLIGGFHLIYVNIDGITIKGFKFLFIIIALIISVSTASAGGEEENANE